MLKQTLDQGLFKLSEISIEAASVVWTRGKSVGQLYYSGSKIRPHFAPNKRAAGSFTKRTQTSCRRLGV